MIKKSISKITQRLLSFLIALLLLGLQTVIAPMAHADPKVDDEEDKITICHRTDSYSNPYESITVNKNAADGIAGNSGNNADHYSEHQGPIFYPLIPKHTEWGDIIPPIDGVHSGLNWTAAGQAVWNNDCNFTHGAIEVNKKVDTEGNGTYESGNTVANSLGFKWGLDGETPANNMGTTVNNVLVGDHTITENTVNGYEFTGWYTGEEHSCTNPSGTTLPVDVKVSKDKTRHITLCNKAVSKGSITIVKDAQPNSDDEFSFQTSGDGLSDFTLTDNASGKGQKTFDELAAGTYTVTEPKTNGWILKTVTCSDGTSMNVDGRTLTITLSTNQHVTCTFTNQKRGRIYVTKVTNPEDDSTPFSLTISGDGNIVEPTTKDIVGGQTISWEVDQGTYSVDEASKDGWITKSNSCVDLTVTADSLNQYCTIINNKLSTIHGHKFNDVNGNGSWDEGEKGLAHWQINLYNCKKVETDSVPNPLSFSSGNIIDSEDNCNNLVSTDWTNKSGEYSFENLAPGRYKVCETQKDYWTQTYPDSVDGCHWIVICESGQVESADFGNHHNVSLEISKSNNKGSAIAGDTVTYTVNVAVPENSDTIYDVNTIDVLPSGFSYVPGSWTAVSSERGDIRNNPTTEPTYGSGSEGTWMLGTMESGETVTLTYKVKIGSTVTPATYTNTVFAKGFDNRNCDGDQEINPQLNSDSFCQQQCNLVLSPFATSNVTVGAVLGESTFTPGHVLGESLLVNTGEQWQPMQFILPVLMLLGTAYLSIATRRYNGRGAK